MIFKKMNKLNSDDSFIFRGEYPVLIDERESKFFFSLRNHVYDYFGDNLSKIYLVGGFVKFFILSGKHLAIQDIDLTVILKKKKKYDFLNRFLAFKTVLQFEHYRFKLDVTICKKEKIRLARQRENVFVVSGLLADIVRRDFIVNSLLLDLIELRVLVVFPVVQFNKLQLISPVSFFIDFSRFFRLIRFSAATNKPISCVNLRRINFFAICLKLKFFRLNRYCKIRCCVECKKIIDQTKRCVFFKEQIFVLLVQLRTNSLILSADRFVDKLLLKIEKNV